jgi:hypothetical protein
MRNSHQKIIVFLKIAIVLFSIALFFLYTLNPDFNEDELCHLHQNWMSLHGKLHYRDYMTQHNPIILYAFAPFMAIVSPHTLLLIRVIIYAIFLYSLTKVKLITKNLTNSELFSYLAIALVPTFLITRQANLEVREDVFLIIFSLMATSIFLDKDKISSLKNNYQIGILFGLSLLSSLKSLPIIISWFITASYLLIIKKINLKSFLAQTLSFSLVIFIFLIALFKSGIFFDYIDSTFKFNQLYQVGQTCFNPFTLSSTKCFNYFAYSFRANAIYWVIMLVGLIYFPFHLKKQKNNYHYLFFSLLLFLHLGMLSLIAKFVFAQYLIVFSIYGSIAISVFLNIINKKITNPKINILIILLIFPYFFYYGRELISKINTKTQKPYTNTTLGQIDFLLKTKARTYHGYSFHPIFMADVDFVWHMGGDRVKHVWQSLGKTLRSDEDVIRNESPDILYYSDHSDPNIEEIIQQKYLKTQYSDLYIIKK